MSTSHGETMLSQFQSSRPMDQLGTRHKLASLCLPCVSVLWLAIQYLHLPQPPLECSSVGNLALRLASSRSNILPVLSVMLVLPIVMGAATSEEHTIPGVTCQALYSPLFMDNFHHFFEFIHIFIYVSHRNCMTFKFVYAI